MILFSLQVLGLTTAEEKSALHDTTHGGSAILWSDILTDPAQSPLCPTKVVQLRCSCAAQTTHHDSGLLSGRIELPTYGLGNRCSIH